jgi:TonB family protein
VTGTVILRALVGEDGRVQDVIIVKSIPMLDAAAEAAVGDWIFLPAMCRSGRVASWVEVTIAFRLGMHAGDLTIAGYPYLPAPPVR